MGYPRVIEGNRKCATIAFWVQYHREEGGYEAGVYSEEVKKALRTGHTRRPRKISSNEVSSEAVGVLPHDDDGKEGES